jgi:hypothetical protein
VRKAFKGILELLVQTELLVLRVFKVCKGTQALLVRKAFKGILELLVQTELLVLRVFKVLLVLQEHKDQREIMEQLEQLVLQVL